jgi:Rad3-related DNA helicase
MEKNCPKCGTIFDAYSKWGEKKYCSRKCANSRSWSEDDKKKKSKSVKEFYQTSQGKDKRKRLSQQQKGNTLSIETRQKISENIKLIYKQNPHLREQAAERARNQTLSEESKKKLSAIAKERGLGGHTSKRKIFFEKKNGEKIYLQSSYEIRLAEILENLNVKWQRPEPLFWYDADNESHRYYPDFQIGNMYIDTKNDYLIKKDEDKINRVRKQNNINLLVLSEEKINQEYIESLLQKNT